MKIGTLRAIAQNIADSLGSGIGMLIGVYEMDVFGEAAGSPDGFIKVDFLSGKATHGVLSPSLAGAVEKYRAALPKLCAKHGASIEDFREITRYSVNRLNTRITVTIEDRTGHRAEEPVRLTAGIGQEQILGSRGELNAGMGNQLCDIRALSRR
jgi:hypothetical protein